jgi:hypothetical protein
VYRANSPISATKSLSIRAVPQTGALRRRHLVFAPPSHDPFVGGRIIGPLSPSSPGLSAVVFQWYCF